MPTKFSIAGGFPCVKFCLFRVGRSEDSSWARAGPCCSPNQCWGLSQDPRAGKNPQDERAGGDESGGGRRQARKTAHS